MSDVLHRFNTLVDRFTQLQGWIQRANELAPRFTPSVVARVVAGHTATRDDLLTDLVPMMAEVEDAAKGADTRRSRIEATVQEAKAALEEIDLRHLIGDLDDAGRDAAAGPHHAHIDGVRDDLEAARAEAETLRDTLSRWEKVGKTAGVLN